MISVVIFYIFSLTFRLALAGDIECNVRYEYERLCECKTVFSRYETIQPLILPPKSEYKYCDNDDLKYHECYKGTCPSDCEEIIRQLNEINLKDKITQHGANNICKWAVGDAGITETGLDVWVQYHPGICDVGQKKITKNLCCNQRCNCAIQLNENQASFINKTTYFTTLPISLKEPYYNCSKFEIAECDNECRASASVYFNNNSNLKDTLKNELNLFEDDQSLGDQFCESIGKKVIYPGLSTKLIINTKPGDLALSKEVHLGTVCCKPKCDCQLFNTNKTANAKEENVMIEFLDTLKEKTYYECSSEFSNCKKSCLNEAGEFFQNNQIKDPFSQGIPGYVNFFRNFTQAGEKLCQKISKQVTKPGLDIYLKVKSEEANNLPENIHFGKLCCSRPCACKLVAKNLAPNYAFISAANVSYGARLIKDLKEYLPKRDLPYDCSKESEECFKDCHIAAGVYLENEKIKSPKSPIQSMDIFFEFKAARNICQAINTKIDKPGLDVFLRYDTESTSYPSYDDLHIGRICCDSILFPANKCKYPLLPDIDNN
jgi:hypothetical protein